MCSDAALAHVDRMAARWEASPYMSMMGAPLRRCIVTHAVMPNCAWIWMGLTAALMIQLKAVALPEGGGAQILLPDGILHPRFAQKKTGRGMWVCGDREVFGRLLERQPHRSVAPHASLPPHLLSLITYQLQLRVVQEAELLWGRARAAAFREAGAAADPWSKRLRLLWDADGSGHGLQFCVSSLMERPDLAETLHTHMRAVERAAPHMCTTSGETTEHCGGFGHGCGT
ncbi:hypothetical protein MSPP1_001783 [Malassezia sp. CBS 17886]|nr:hypothetical protein MSPP1_001783 [Malassezia sp. CBS 17886]